MSYCPTQWFHKASSCRRANRNVSSPSFHDVAYSFNAALDDPHCCGGCCAESRCPLSQWHPCTRHCCATSTSSHGRGTDFFTAASGSLRLRLPLLLLMLLLRLRLHGRRSTMCRVFSLHCLVVLSLLSFLPHFSSSASSARLRVSSTLSSSRACSAALLAARQIRRRPRAVRMCGPLSTRINHAFHHDMCLLDVH